MRSMGDLQTDACAVLGAIAVRPLKAGGQKSVVLVDRGTERLVLKLVQVGVSEPSALERARREFELLTTTSHPNIVKVVSDLVLLGSPPDGAAWLEEYLDGDDLSDLVRVPWEWNRVVDLGLALSAGLAVLHRQGVVHRDLSANNVRVLSSGAYKIMDPGFARHTLRSGITVGGQPGTPSFMTPEHLTLSGPTPASDVFAAGALMYLAATGSVPIPWRGDDADYAARLGLGLSTPIDRVRDDAPPAVAGVVTRALHPQPARRFRNGDYLHTALEAVR
jgi:serine/threonine-protein kinase